MKTLFLAAALTGVSLTSSVLADISGLALRADPVGLNGPKPTTVVQPTNLPRSFAGGVITVEFSLDPAGRPREIQFPGVNDPQLADRVLQAFSQWRFELAATGALTPGTRFVLPLEIRPRE